MPRTKGSYTNAVRARINEVVTTILEDPRFFQSKSNSELYHLVKEKYNVKERQAKAYIQGAKEMIADMLEKKKEKSLERALLDREDLYRKSKETFDYKLSLEVAKDRDKLLGLYEDKIIHSGEVAVTFIEKLDE